MRRCWSLPLIVLSFIFIPIFIFCTLQLQAQVESIVIAAGTPEDHDLQSITAEQDGQKKLTMYQDFVQKYAANPAAVAYGNWQIAQAYQAAGDLPKALDYGDKAMVGAPRDLDIIVSQANISQQAKNNSKLVGYASKGGEVCTSIGKQAKPEGMSDEDFGRKVKEEQSSAEGSCNYLETSALNAISGENDPQARMTDIEKFTTGFPNSKYGETVSNLALDALSQLKDNARMVAFGEKILAANPNSLTALLLLANFYSEDKAPGSAAKTISYSQRVIEVAKADAPDADKAHKLSAGAAHSTIGWAYLKQDKSAAAIPELKAASVLLRGLDDQQDARALYGLGFAYGKLNKLSEAREVLQEAVKIPGPLQAMSQDLLTKVNAARAKGR
jgi:tetratricopeptide (TPR) repeat protein